MSKISKQNKLKGKGSQPREQKESYSEKYAKIVFANADPSMIPQKPEIRDASKLFHIVGYSERLEEEFYSDIKNKEKKFRKEKGETVFSKLSQAQEEAKSHNLNVITESTLEKGEEHFKEYFWFFDGQEWGKYKGKERINKAKLTIKETK